MLSDNKPLPEPMLLQGWGLLSQFPQFRYFPHFSTSPKHTLAIEYHIYIWRVSPQLSCGDTCQMWMSFKESNMYFCKIKNLAHWEINKRSFSNPHPRSISLFCHLATMTLGVIDFVCDFSIFYNHDSKKRYFIFTEILQVICRGTKQLTYMVIYVLMDYVK